MQKPKVGSVVVLTRDFDNKDYIFQKGTLGVVFAITNDPISWGIKELGVDFGTRAEKSQLVSFHDMSFILPYDLPKEAKAKKQKDKIAVKL